MRINDSLSGGGSTVVLEMQSNPQQPSNSEKDVPVYEDVSAGALPSPTTATPQLQKWNSPRINMWRCLATFYSFIILGANDGAYGALIPYLETYYHVNYTVISLVFLSPIVGYTMSALLNNHIHTIYGQRGVAIIMSVSHVCAYSQCVNLEIWPQLTSAFSCHLSSPSLRCACGRVHPRRVRQRPRRQRVVGSGLPLPLLQNKG
jgi:hypothetical protein